MILLKRIREKIRLLFLNNKIKRYKYIHFMFNDKFNKPFVDFLNKNFDKKEHLILCKRWFNQFPFPEGENVIKIKTFKGLDFYQKSIKKLIFHSLFDEECFDLLYNQKQLLDKSYWVVWGGDLYNIKNSEKQNYVKSNFRGYNTLDEKVIIDMHKPKKCNFFIANYSFPISIASEYFSDIKLQSKVNAFRVQINNSSDRTTIEMLNVLYKFKEHDITYFTVLSYGDLSCKDDIIKIGVDKYEGNFLYLEDYIDPSGYALEIAKNDIFILNQNRQQGFGNVIASLYLGKKVFIRNDVTTYDYLHKNGIYVYDTKTISDLTYEEFIKNDYAEQNKKNIIKLMSEENLVKCWQELFDDK